MHAVWRTWSPPFSAPSDVNLTLSVSGAPEERCLLWPEKNCQDWWDLASEPTHRLGRDAGGVRGDIAKGNRERQYVKKGGGLEARV